MSAGLEERAAFLETTLAEVNAPVFVLRSRDDYMTLKHYTLVSIRFDADANKDLDSITSHCNT